MSEWQDISTAPRDGTKILLWLKSPYSTVEKAGYYEPWDVWLSGHLPSDPDLHEPYGIGSLVPTHWQPLPEPPE